MERRHHGDAGDASLTLGPSGGGDADADVSAILAALESDTTRLLAQRIRAACYLVLASTALFLLVEGVAGRWHARSVACRLLQLATVSGTVGLMRGPCSRRRAVVVACVASTVVCVTSALATLSSPDTGLLLFMTHTMGTATLLPWGGVAQTVGAGGAVIGLGVNLLLAPVAAAASPERVVAAAVAMATSIYVAFTLERYRRTALRAQAEVRASDRRKAAIIDDALESIVTVDAAGRVIDLNPAARATFGAAAPATVPPALSDLVAPPLGLHDGRRDASADGGAADALPGFPLDRCVETIAWRGDGAPFPVELKVVRLRAFASAGFTAYLRDLTERNLAAEARTASSLVHAGRELMGLLESVVLLRRVAALGTEMLGAARGAVLEPDPTGRLWTVIAETPQGLEPGTTLAAAALDAVLRVLAHPDAAAIVDLPREAAERLGLAGVSAQPVIGVGIWAGDGLAAVALYARAPGAETFSREAEALAGGLAQVASLALTNARLVEAFAHASRVKSEFVSTMSHELRTPLNAIIGYAEMAADEALAPADRRELATRVARSGRELLELIEGTLEIGRLEAGASEAVFEPLHLIDFWREQGERWSGYPRRPGVTLEWQRGVPAVDLVTDPVKLASVLRNLVGNAVKFTECGSVRVTARVTADDRLEIQVADTGIGIAPSDHAIVFEMFRQADGSDTRRFGGTGLGLYITRRFVEQLGGSVRLESALGRGSTFTVSLPRDAAVALGRAVAA